MFDLHLFQLDTSRQTSDIDFLRVVSPEHRPINRYHRRGQRYLIFAIKLFIAGYYSRYIKRYIKDGDGIGQNYHSE